MKTALARIRTYLSTLEIGPGEAVAEAGRISAVHISDHLQRLAQALEPRDLIHGSPRLAAWEDRLAGTLSAVAAGTPPQPNLGTLSAATAAWRRTERPAILQEAATTGSNPAELLRELDTLQWLDRLAYHFARIEAHLAAIEEKSDPPPPA